MDKNKIVINIAGMLFASDVEKMPILEILKWQLGEQISKRIADGELSQDILEALRLLKD